jgi:hypothetical protein
MRRRLVASALGGAAAAGLLTGVALGALSEANSAGAGRQSGPPPTGGGPADGAPSLAFLSPSAEPSSSGFNPDFGYLRGLRGGAVLFDRVTLTRATQGSFAMDNKGGILRRQRFAEEVRVLGGVALTGRPGPIEVPLDTLREYLRRSAASTPLLVWVRYDHSGKIVEVQEKGRP